MLRLLGNALKRRTPILVQLSTNRPPFLSFSDPNEEREFRRLVAAAREHSHDHDADSHESGGHDVLDKRSSDKQDTPQEIDGPSGPEPTRYGDWERKGRVSDF